MNTTKQKIDFKLPTRSSSRSLRWRLLLLFWAVLLITFGGLALGLHHYLTQNGLHRFSLRPGDEMELNDVTHDLSSVLCSQYHVTVERGRAVVFLLDANHLELVDGREKFTDRFQLGGLGAEENFRYQMFYLIKGSILHIDGCQHLKQISRTSHAYLLVIKGWQDFLAWKKKDWTADSRNDYLDRHGLPLTHADSRSCWLEAINMVIEQSDQYFVVLTTRNGTEFKGHASIQVKRKFYSIQHKHDACYDDTVCSFQLELNLNYDVIVYIRNDVARTAEASLVSTACVPRTVIWVAIFGGTPLAIILTSLILAVICSGWSSRHFRDKRKASSGSKNRHFRYQNLDAVNKGYKDELSSCHLECVKPKNLRVQLSEKELARFLE